MSLESHSPLEQLIEDQRRVKSMRQESVGPVSAAAGMVRESCAAIRLMLDDLESAVGFHLDVLDALLRRRLGSRWWEEPCADTGPTEEGF